MMEITAFQHDPLGHFKMSGNRFDGILYAVNSFKEKAMLTQSDNIMLYFH